MFGRRVRFPRVNLKWDDFRDISKKNNYHFETGYRPTQQVGPGTRCIRVIFSNAFTRDLSKQKCDLCYVKFNGTVFDLHLLVDFGLNGDFFTDFGGFLCMFVDIFEFFYVFILRYFGKTKYL